MISASTSPRRPTPSQRTRAALPIIVLLLAGIVLAACGSSQPSEVAWRNIDIDLPDGWYVFEDAEDRLSISNVDLAAYAEDGEIPDGDVVAMFFTFEPSTLPNDWREWLADIDAEVETDDRLVLRDDVPATRLIFRYDTGGITTREMVALIPSRSVVVLAQPVPRPGQQDAPELFLDYLETFLEVLETAGFGPPVLE